MFSSIPLNISEGCGRPKIEDRKRFYSIARGSAMECAAISDLLLRMQPQLAQIISSSKKHFILSFAFFLLSFSNNHF